VKNGKSRVVFISVIGFVFLYLLYATAQFGGGGSARRAESVRQIIDKALVQCYALEGSYPPDLSRVAEYGVVFDYDTYIYHYEWAGGNLKPFLSVIEK
jgi:hypothetical protein